MISCLVHTIALTSYPKVGYGGKKTHDPIFWGDASSNTTCCLRWGEETVTCARGYRSTNKFFCSGLFHACDMTNAQNPIRLLIMDGRLMN